MDPLTAIGLLGNIVTFIDFGLNVVSKAQEIHKATSGATAENESLTSMLLQFDTVVTEIHKRQSLISGGQDNLIKLAKECMSVSDELRSLLEALKTRKSGSRMSSMRAAYRDWRKKDEKRSLEEKLNRCRQELLLLLAAKQGFEFSDRLDKIVSYGQSSQREFTSLHDAVDALSGALDARCLNDDALDTIRDLVERSSQATIKVREGRVLAGLRFESVNERFDDVAEAHAATFNWIFMRPEEENSDMGQDSGDDFNEAFEEDASKYSSENVGDETSHYPPYAPSHNSSNKSSDYITSERRSYHLQEEKEILPQMAHARDSFIDWLTHGSKVFHISGKPGSGKSTLMKYLCSHEQTRQYLEEWAKPKAMILGKFFFWKPGNTFQKTLKGLVRGLLYSIISQAPELIPVIFPKQWDTTAVSPTITFDSHSEIQRAFLAIMGCGEVYECHKFAFFIDGLDEFEGNHVEMVNLLLRWVNLQTSNVKICVSSRDWIVFQDLFDSFPRIRLHELTHHDIRGLVESTLDINQQFRQFDNAGEQLKHQIVDKSAGVFLWVMLILRDVEEGLRCGDSMALLEAKVDSLPTELEELFGNIFSQIQKADQRDAYAILAVTLQCPVNWPLIRFAYLEDYLKDVEFAMTPN
ncbi:hypothetical protein BJY04DRAFT_217758 [Aspergillus karnatakaensis]|uniref:uncharacterized protein n=1 Tax=Aspergillus karnatakaensis TaxID=1810916 RepID=UPI003CCD6841